MIGVATATWVAFVIGLLFGVAGTLGVAVVIAAGRADRAAAEARWRKDREPPA